MSYFQKYPPRILLAILFLLMLALAASISITGGSIARRILVVLIPFLAVILGAVSTTDRVSCTLVPSFDSTGVSNTGTQLQPTL
jgi:hypothetical protein